jgi:endonuclease YncB( thermonuclease family)
LDAQAEGPFPCFSTPIGTFEVSAATDGRTLKLADGREVRIAGIEVPPGSHATAGKAALGQWVMGKTVILKQAEPGHDRYGRLVAHIFVPQDGAERWLQQDLLTAGYAQVSASPGNASCTKALLAAETPARQDRRGLWADSSFAVKASDDLAGLMTRRGQFTVAEGRVVSVRESRGTIYVNFGRVWSRNLTVTILGRNRSAFEAAGIDLKKLEGARLRVRGFIEERGGPRIEAARPEQIEIAARE